MDEDAIDEIAAAFAEQLRFVYAHDIEFQGAVEHGILDCIEAVALVINSYNPTYDLRYFYKNTGYNRPYPEHPVK